jgi:predicted small integral membrane protein
MMVYGIGSTALADFFVTIGLLLQILFCWAKLEKKTNIHLQIYTQKTCRGQTFGCAAPKLKKKTWP